MVTISRIVPGIEDQTKAFGTANATSALARMIGPPLAAPLLFSAGVTRFWQEIFDGLRMLVRNRVIFAILVCAMVCQVGVGALNTNPC
jgi:hypothetical protein